MTKSEALIRIVAGLVADNRRSGRHADYVRDALAFLDEIEKVCVDAEREACAKVVEEFSPITLNSSVAERIATAIRARGGR